MMSTILRFFASDVVAKGIAVMFIPFFSYLLGPIQLGLFSEWFTLYNVFAAVVSLGVPSYALVMMSRDHDDHLAINKRVLRFLGEWCLFVGILNLIFLYFSPNLLFGLGLYFAAVFFAVINYAAAILRHYQSFKKYLLLQLALAAATSVLPILCVIYSPSWEARTVGYVIGLLVLAIVVYLFAQKSVRLGSINRAFRIDALRFGFSIALMSGLAWFKLGADIQFLKSASGYESSGVLFFSFQIVSIVSIIAASLNRSSSPTFYRLIHESNSTDFKRLITRLMIGLALLAGLTVIVAYLLVEYFLAEFRASMFLIYPMVLGAVIYGCGQFIASVYLYCKKAHLLAWCVGISSVFHPLMSYFLVFQLGWNWIGYSYLASSVLFLIMVGLNLYKVREVW